MRRLSRCISLALLFSLTSCGLLTPSPAIQIATPSSGTPAPAAEVRFIVQAPQGTQNNADLQLVLLDPVTDLGFNPQRIPLKAQGDGRWSVTLTPPVGSLIYYRYEKIGPTEAIEVTAGGKLVDYRTAYISGPGEIHEVVARWSDEPFQGESGRMLGQVVSAADGQPLREMLISAGGHLTFTDGEGRFRVDNLPVGRHSVTAFSPTGSHHPHQQEALIAANSTTPAEIRLDPAEQIVVTFQVQVPADTPEHATLRLAGNIAQLGFRFKSSEYGTYQSVSQMPALVRVDPVHYLGVFTLYSGTYLQYKYTLGDGVWNAERSPSGAFVSRSANLESENTTLRDQVTSWSESPGDPTRFEVAIPEQTPPDDSIAIQFKAGNWRAPLPMWPQDLLWTYSLYGPQLPEQNLEYRFCRNMQCGVADETDFAGQDAAGRTLSREQTGTLIQTVVDQWQWFDDTALQQEVTTDSILMDQLTQGGVEYTSDYDPSWLKHMPAAFNSINESGANEVILAPAWTWVQNNPYPILEFDPTSAPFDQELKEFVQLGRERGIRIALRPSFDTDGIPIDTWWQQARRNQLWWELWFEEYHSLLLSYASWAQQNGAEKLIIGGPELIPALPFGSLPDGVPSGVPVDSEVRWRNLMTEVRQQFAGQLVFELEYSEELSLIPPFIDLFDQVHIYWHSPIGTFDQDIEDIQQATIKGQLDQVLNESWIQDKDISISLAYLSLEDSSGACPPQPDGSCRPLEDFSRGRLVDIDLERDLSAQAQAYNAILRALADEPRIQGVFSRGFYPAVILYDKSLSIYGKPAQDVLAEWFQGLQPTR